MKRLLLFLFLLHTQVTVESSSPLQVFATALGDFASLVKTKLDNARHAFKSLINQIFHERTPPIDNHVISFSESSLSGDNKRVTKPGLEVFKIDRSTHPVEALIRTHGKICTKHTLNTRDGYEIVLHRLINPLGVRGIKQTVLLHHGLLGSSADWVLLGREKSLPYYLLTLGYDVWFANSRGNQYSHSHLHHLANSTEYWNFSWQEIGLYDLPAIIDYIRQRTREPINFIGHSMGATALLVMLSSLPRYNDYLRMAILLGPLVYMRHLKGPLRMLSTTTDTPSDELFRILGKGHFMPNKPLPDDFLKRFCLDEVKFCSNPLFFVAGVPRNHSSWNKDFVNLLFQHVPAGGSTKTFLHYAQLIRSGKFHKFGKVAEEYPLKQVTTPIALISSSDDWLATIPDIVRLYINIFNPLEHFIIRDRNVSHTDFVWGPDANKIIYPKVIDMLQSSLHLLGKQVNEV